MSDKDSHFPPVRHTSSIPNLDCGIIRSGINNVRRSPIAIADSVNILPMTPEPKNRCSCFNIVYIETAIVRTGNDLATIPGKSYGPYLYHELATTKI